MKRYIGFFITAVTLFGTVSVLASSEPTTNMNQWFTHQEKNETTHLITDVFQQLDTVEEELITGIQETSQQRNLEMDRFLDETISNSEQNITDYHHSIQNRLHETINTLDQNTIFEAFESQKSKELETDIHSALTELFGE